MKTARELTEETVQEIVQEPIRCLAAAVLLNAVKAKQVERTDIMEFWCDVVEIDPDVFFERANRKVI